MGYKILSKQSKMVYDEFEAFTVNIPLKIFVCFLLSAFVFVGIMVLYFYGSIVNEPVEPSMLVAVFLTLFLFFFFCFNMRQAPADKEEEPVVQDYIPGFSSLNGHENDDDEYEELTELEEIIEEIDVVSSLAASNDIVEIAELEDIATGSGGIITIFRQPFAFSTSNPDVLQGAAGQVIYEQNGIHYINNNLDSDSAGRELDNNFAKLVESVLISPTPRN